MNLNNEEILHTNFPNSLFNALFSIVVPLSLVVVGRRVHHLLVLEDKYLLQGIAAQEQEQPHYIS